MRTPLGLKLEFEASDWSNVLPPFEGLNMPEEIEQDFALEASCLRTVPVGACNDDFDRVARSQQIFRTLVVTHVECKNHITPPSSGVEYLAVSSESDDSDSGVTNSTMSGEKRRRSSEKGSPEQPERVTAVFDALKLCTWECGGVRVVECVELTTSPRLATALDDNVADWASSSARKKAPPRRSTSVAYLFDDIEPIVLSVHDMGYLSRIANHVEEITEDRLKLYRCVSLTATGDTFASARSLHAALCASFAVCRAVDSVVSGEFRNAFCCVRPPGHHAGACGSTTDDNGQLVGQGFCIINHVAVAARYALANHNASIRRIAVIDFDLHHGNGTQQILSNDDGPLARDALCDAVLFCSIHGATPPGHEPHLFPGTARRPTNRDTVNIPLGPGTGHAEFLERFQHHVVPAVERFQPDLILVSAGFDGHKDDLFKFFKLTDKTFKLVTELVVDLAAKVCNGRVVSVLEGGYDIPTLVRCCTVHVRALATHKQPLPVTNARTARSNSSSPL